MAYHAMPSVAGLMTASWVYVYELDVAMDSVRQWPSCMLGIPKTLRDSGPRRVLTSAMALVCDRHTKGGRHDVLYRGYLGIVPFSRDDSVVTVTHQYYPHARENSRVAAPGIRFNEAVAV